MSYLVLARKYRPQNFDEMVGQEHVVKALSNALAQQRLHHAYLFTGTRGVGKTTVSRILAKSLNCQGSDGQGGITAHPCGVCQACRDIDAGRFVDYTELDAASNRGVEEVQSLMEQAVYKPVQGRFKVFMIDEVHMLSNTAFNAMLKTLEEPPEYLKFVLATTDPQKVPVTVLSRCLQFNLRPMAPQTIVEHLQHVLGREGVAQDHASLQLLARAARGSMRDALSLTDQAIAYGNGALQEAAVRQMLGVVDKRYVYETIEALAAAQGQQVVALADTLRREGIPAASLLEDMALALQKIALYQSVPEIAEAAAGDADGPQLAALARSLPPDETQLLYSFCLKGREELGLAPDEYSGLVMVLLRLLAFKTPPGTALASLPAPTPVAVATPLPSAAGTQGRGDAVATSAAPVAVVGVAADASGSPDASVSAGVPPAAASEPRAEAAAPPPSVEAMAPVPATAVSAGVRAPLPWEDSAAAAPVSSKPAEAAPETDPPPSREQGSAFDGGVAPARSALPSATAPETIAAPCPAPTDAFPVQEAAPVDAPERPASSIGAASSSDATMVSAAPLPPADGPLSQWWHGLVQSLIEQGQLIAVVRELAMQSQLQKRDDTGLLLRVANQTLMNESLRTKLQAALQSAGVPGRLTLEHGEVTHSLAQQLEADRQEAYRVAHRIVEGDARVQWLCSHLGGEIVPGSVQPVALAGER